MDVLNALGHGFHEKIYENAMMIALKKAGLSISQQKSYDVHYQGESVGTFIPDIVIDNQIIVELKTIDCIGKNELGQVLNYLRVSGLPVGIILNFKNSKLEWQRVVL